MRRHRRKGHLVFVAGLRDLVEGRMHGMLLLWLTPGLVGFLGRHLVRVGFGGGYGCHLGRDSGSRRRTFIRFVDVVSEDLLYARNISG